MFRSIGLAVALLGVTAPSYASTSSATFNVTLEAPVAERVRIIADGAVWVCEDVTCTGTLKRTKVSTKACKAFAKEAGRVVTYSTGSQSLSADEIADCNTRAK